MKFLVLCFERSSRTTALQCWSLKARQRFVLGASGANRRTSALEHGPPSEGQALFPAGSDFPERVKVFLHESLRALIGPIQADA